MLSSAVSCEVVPLCLYKLVALYAAYTMRAYEVIIFVFFDSLIIQSESDCPLGALTRSFFSSWDTMGGSSSNVL